jgi:hypothetical protein
LKRVAELVNSLKIQVDNLCTFLPQEKVGKFTEFNLQKLLVETEQALSAYKLWEKHQRLINLRA